MKTLTDQQKADACRRSKEWAQRNRDKVRERSRLRSKQPEVRAYQKKYRDSRIAERREYNRKWRAANPEKVLEFAAAYRDRNRESINTKNKELGRRLAGLPTPTRPQPDNCENCGKSERSMHLDHCHRTGKFRGWLCGRCNRGLGYFDDCLEGVLRVAGYLERHG